MDRVNPVYIPRNHLVEEALARPPPATSSPSSACSTSLARPFDERPGLEGYAEPAPRASARYVTFCGT